MTKKVRVVLNRQGVRSLLRSNELKRECSEYANKALAKLGDGYKTDTYTGKTRSNAMILADSSKARREARSDNTIWKAVKGR